MDQKDIKPTSEENVVCSIEISEVSYLTNDENDAVTQGENPLILKILLNQFFIRTFYEST
jgi:hypothetical protein